MTESSEHRCKEQQEVERRSMQVPRRRVKIVLSFRTLMLISNVDPRVFSELQVVKEVSSEERRV